MKLFTERPGLDSCVTCKPVFLKMEQKLMSQFLLMIYFEIFFCWLVGRAASWELGCCDALAVVHLVCSLWALPKKMG